ncbi:skin secretory protein xP2-like [Cinclus cinclus]|uniref:skin secretory protein xP2-like n=1 Tax=Cinclus cinclus TaxID=127875 RepID=UPI002E135F36
MRERRDAEQHGCSCQDAGMRGCRDAGIPSSTGRQRREDAEIPSSTGRQRREDAGIPSSTGRQRREDAGLPGRGSAALQGERKVGMRGRGCGAPGPSQAASPAPPRSRLTRPCHPPARRRHCTPPPTAPRPPGAAGHPPPVLWESGSPRPHSPQRQDPAPRQNQGGGTSAAPRERPEHPPGAAPPIPSRSPGRARSPEPTGAGCAPASSRSREPPPERGSRTGGGRGRCPELPHGDAVAHRMGTGGRGKMGSCPQLGQVPKAQIRLLAAGIVPFSAGLPSTFRMKHKMEGHYPNTAKRPFLGGKWDGEAEARSRWERVREAEVLEAAGKLLEPKTWMSPGMFLAPSPAPIPPLGSAPDAVGAPPVLLQPCLAMDHQDFGKSIPVGPLPVSPHPGQPKGPCARSVALIPQDSPFLLHWMLSPLQGLGGDPTPRVPSQTGPQQVRSTLSHPGAAQHPSQEHPYFEASSQVVPENHLVPPPLDFDFSSCSILIPVTSRSQPGAHPAFPLSRGVSGNAELSAKSHPERGCEVHTDLGVVGGSPHPDPGQPRHVPAPAPNPFPSPPHEAPSVFYSSRLSAAPARGGIFEVQKPPAAARSGRGQHRAGSPRLAPGSARPGEELVVDSRHSPAQMGLNYLKCFSRELALAV